MKIWEPTQGAIRVRIFGQSTKGRRWFPSQFQALDAPDPLFSLFDKVSLPGVVPVGQSADGEFLSGRLFGRADFGWFVRWTDI